MCNVCICIQCSCTCVCTACMKIMIVLMTPAPSGPDNDAIGRDNMSSFETMSCCNLHNPKLCDFCLMEIQVTTDGVCMRCTHTWHYLYVCVLYVGSVQDEPWRRASASRRWRTWFCETRDELHQRHKMGEGRLMLLHSRHLHDDPPDDPWIWLMHRKSDRATLSRYIPTRRSSQVSLFWDKA